MTDQHSKLRQQAEAAFGKAQSPASARDRAFEELDLIAIARSEKTDRLREARLAKKSQDQAAASQSPSKRSKRT